jgi:hypothetical protein
MFFCREITIPAQTALTTPYQTTLKLSEGVIVQVWVRWYYGSGNLCGVRLMLDQFTFWPMTLGQWFVSSPYPLTLPESHQLTNAPYSLSIEGYNQDDVYDHNCWIGIAVNRAKATSALETFLNWINSQG